MTLPETDVARVRRWVVQQDERIGEHIDEIGVEMDMDTRAITVRECRRPWREDFGPVASTARGSVNVTVAGQR